MVKCICSLIRRIGHFIIEFVWQAGFIARFLFLLLRYSGTCLIRPRLIGREIYFSGFLSLIVIMVCGLFVGMIFGYQGYDILNRFASGEATGMLVAVAVGRELGPVMTALLFASRAGSSITSEIGLMKTTEQITALDMMAVNPLARVAAPKFWGGVISMPFLSAFFTAMAILGGYLVVVGAIGVDANAYWSQTQGAVDWQVDFVRGFIKSIVFGVTVTLIAVFEGYEAVPTAEGVSRATTRTIVKSSLIILGFDFILTVFLF